MHVVIIGGGLAGLTTAYTLRKSNKDVRITLIEPKSYLEVPWATIRALFDADIATACTIPLAGWAVKYNIKHKKTKATALTASQVTLATGQTLPFDACVIATGSKNPAVSLSRPAVKLDAERRRKEMKEQGKELLKAKKVLVIGGGSVGAEFATDIAGFARRAGKDVQVTLVHSGSHLVPEFSPNAAAKYQRQAEMLGVKVLLKRRAVQDDKGWKLKNGERLDADVVVNCVGVTAQNEFVKIEGALNDKGWIVVDEFLRVGGKGRVFATGDCCDWGMLKSGVNAMGNKGVVAKNVLEVLKAKGDLRGVKLKRKSEGPTTVLVTAGPDMGVFGTPIGSFSWGLPALKNRTMLLFGARHEIGLGWRG